MSNQLDRIDKMLTSLLRSEGLTHWVGGYVYGRTSNDDPYILLYPANEQMKEKCCRVYDRDFGKLPDFINTQNTPYDTDANPSKDQARRKGIYHESPHLFQIVLYHGKETQMGREKRFHDVLSISNKPRQNNQNGAGPSQQPPPPQSPSQPDPDAMDKLLAEEAANARSLEQFLSAVNQLRPFYNEKAGQFFPVIFPNGWQQIDKRAAVSAMMAYADARTKDKDHNAAKAVAWNSYRAAQGTQQVSG